MSRAVVFLLALVSAGLLSRPAGAQTIYLLTETGALATTSADAPLASTTAGLITTTPVMIAGVTAGETLVAIDVRPLNQRLYALGVDASAGKATLYHLAPESGFAAAVGRASAIAFTTDGATAVSFPDPATVDWDIDFNPTDDRVRVVAGSLNFRVDPNTGEPEDGDNTGLTDGIVAGTNPDGPITNATTKLAATASATAFSNNEPNAAATTQYTVDAGSGSLSIQSPATGAQSLVGTVAIGAVPLVFSRASFDIPPEINTLVSNQLVTAGKGLLVASVAGVTGLYGVDLRSGEAAQWGTIGLAVRSSAVVTTLGAAIALSADGTELLSFDPADPATTTSVTLSGVSAGETLVGIDGRPQTGQLYALGIDTNAKNGTLYLIDPDSGEAVVVGTEGGIAFVDGAANPVGFPNPANTGYGFDFNPATDLIRVIAGNGLNFRVNPQDGTPVDSDNNPTNGINPDGVQTGPSGGIAGATGAAYTNSFAQALTSPAGPTTLYTLDATSGTLAIQNPPNAGTQTNPVAITLTPGGTSLAFSALGGFDIPSPVAVPLANIGSTGEGWFAATVASVTGIYRVNLATGQATSFGAIDDGMTSVAGLVVWATVPALVVENPPGTVVADEASTVTFASVRVGGATSTTIVLRNLGSQPLTYSTSFVSGTAFSATVNDAGTIPGSGSVMVTLTFEPDVAEPVEDMLHIESDDPAIASFEVKLAGIGLKPPEIQVESPVGTITEDASLLEFGGSPVGVPVTRTVLLRNLGEVPLLYTTMFDDGTEFVVTKNPQGTIPQAGTVILEVTYTPLGGDSSTDVLHIISDDPETPSFDLDLTGEGFLPQTDDIVVTTRGPTRFNPLGNDIASSGMRLVITDVSAEEVTTDGSALFIPEGFTGIFTYITDDGVDVRQGSVTVTAGTPAVAPRTYNGVLTDAMGNLFGWATVTLVKNRGTVKAITLFGQASGALNFPADENTIAVTTRVLDDIEVSRSPDVDEGTVVVTVFDISGVLHPIKTKAKAEKFNVALASIDSQLLGGAYGTVSVAKNGSVKLRGVLPDGNKFSAGTTMTDNNGIAYYAVQSKGTKPPGSIGGELTPADLPASDVTGEMIWYKPEPEDGSKGTEPIEVDTILTVNGSRVTGSVPLPTGIGTLKLSGGNLPSAETAANLTITAGVPPVPTGSLVTWKAGKPKASTFSFTVTVPTLAKPVKGTGVYLPKTKRAWGYFPGTMLGGRVEITIP